MARSERRRRAAVAASALLIIVTAGTALLTRSTDASRPARPPLGTAGAARPASAGGRAALVGSVPVFQVGTAVVNIDPPADDPQYLGGFGTMDHPTAKVHDPLEVRAFVVRRGATTLALASADSQGWFLESDQGPYGIDDVRNEVAGWLRTHGSPHAQPADIVVSATHSHAAPTVMGIWGPPNPRYQRQLRDATVRAIEQATLHTRPAQLWTADADITDVIGHTVRQTDLYDGWTIDSDLPVLWARDPATGKTVGLYANVPVHADVVSGADMDAMSADHIGGARTRLDAMLGGTSVLAMGTLGRQESIVQTNGLTDAGLVADYVANRIRWALASAQPITDPTLAAASVPVTVPATGAPLLALLAAEHVAPGKQLPVVDNYGVGRASYPPYQTGTVIGTQVAGLRIGDVLYVTEPGEAFPEVSAALRQQVPGARVRIIGMALDQLGYYYPAVDTVVTAPAFVFGGSDHFEYNASIVLAALTQQAGVGVADKVGFEARYVPATSGIVDSDAAEDPGVQFFAVPPQGPGRTVVLDPSWNRAKDDTPLQQESRGPILWDFGDGSVARSSGAVHHTYARAGTYRVRASVADVQERTRSYEVVVQVGVATPPLPAIDGNAGAGSRAPSAPSSSSAGAGAGARSLPGPSSAPAAGGSSADSVYDVGAASRSINPTAEQLASGRFFLGGYGLGGGGGLSKLITSGRRATGILDGVSARALVVGDGAHAIVLAQIETQGWFAAYADGPWGADAISHDAAAEIAAINRSGTDTVSPDAILVDSDHTHAGPDTVGAWGGVPDSYLELVHDRTVDAIVDAWRHRQAAHLSFGTAKGGVAERHDPDALIHNQLGDDPANSTVDDELRVIQARSVRTGKVIVTYLNFSAHPTVLGSDNTLVSADYPGVVSRKMAARYGGFGFDQVGTLGRTQPERGECPNRALKGAAQSRCALDSYANRVMAKVDVAVRRSSPLRGPATVELQRTLIHDVATNPTVLALLEGGSAIDAQLLRAGAPWADGPVVQTVTYSGRIGPLLISGEPGEAYPQIALGVRSAVPGMRGYLSIGTAGDFLGYLVAPANAYPGVLKAAAAGNDNFLFNASFTLGSRVECSLIAGAGRVLDLGDNLWKRDPGCLPYNADLVHH